MAHRLLAVLAVLVLATAAGAADRSSSGSRTGQSAATAIEGVWSGRYFYPNNSNPSVPFELRVTSRQGSTFRGRTSEPNTFGDAGILYLFADVAGTVAPDGSIRFEKTYDGTGGADHSVIYTGTLGVAGVRVEGSWAISDQAGGRFEMQRVE